MFHFIFHHFFVCHFSLSVRWVILNIQEHWNECLNPTFNLYFYNDVMQELLCYWETNYEIINYLAGNSLMNKKRKTCFNHLNPLLLILQK